MSDMSTSAQLRQTQQDLAASQQDLTYAMDQMADAIRQKWEARKERDDARLELAGARERHRILWGRERDTCVRLRQERDLARAELATARAMIHDLELARDRLSSENIRLGVQVGTLAEALSAYAQPEPS